MSEDEVGVTALLQLLSSSFYSYSKFRDEEYATSESLTE